LIIPAYIINVPMFYEDETRDKGWKSSILLWTSDFFFLELGCDNLYISQLTRRSPRGGRHFWRGEGGYRLWDRLLDSYWYKWQTVLLRTDQKLQHFEWWVSEWVSELCIVLRVCDHIQDRNACHLKMWNKCSWKSGWQQWQQGSFL
jgi:hypothetical protein